MRGWATSPIVPASRSRRSTSPSTRRPSCCRPASTSPFSGPSDARRWSSPSSPTSSPRAPAGRRCRVRPRQHRDPRARGRDQGGRRVRAARARRRRCGRPERAPASRGPGQIVDLLADRFGLRAGLDVRTGTDLMMMLSSSAPYLTLQRYRTERGGVLGRWPTSAGEPRPAGASLGRAAPRQTAFRRHSLVTRVDPGSRRSTCG